MKSKRFWEKVEIGESEKCWPFSGGRDKHGYGVLRFRVDGKTKTLQAHRFAYADKVGPLLEEEKVRHKCDNPPCCNPSHLIKGSQADNVRDRDERGRGRWHSGATHSKSILSQQETAIEIRSKYGPGVRYLDLAKEYNVSVATIRDIVKGIHWSARGLPPVPVPQTAHATRGRTKLSPIQVDEIRTRYSQGMTQPELASLYGVSQTNISSIIRRASWA